MLNVISDDKKFDQWWRENREELLKMYNEGIDPNMTVMTIAQLAWKAAQNAK